MSGISHALSIDAPPQQVFDAINRALAKRAFRTDQSECDSRQGSVAVVSFGPNAETQLRFDHRDWASADGRTYTWGRIVHQLDGYVRTGTAKPPFNAW